MTQTLPKCISPLEGDSANETECYCENVIVFYLNLIFLSQAQHNYQLSESNHLRVSFSKTQMS